MSFKNITTMALIGAILSASGIFAQKKIIVPKDCASIQKGIDEAAEHDTVFILQGIYKENIILKDNIAVIGQDAEKTVISGNGSKPVVEGANFCLLKNVTIEKGGTGILCKNINQVIEHVIVRNNKNTGIHCLISLPEIKNNLICNNKWSGIYCELIASAQRTSINHNLIADNGYSGIMLANRSEVLIENNIFHSNKQYGIFVNEDSKRSRIIFNDFFENRSPFNSFAMINETNITKDPGLSSQDRTSFSGIAGKTATLKEMGKDHTDIGPLSEAAIGAVSKDIDNDGIPDVKDQCPDMPEDKDGFQDEDGCPDFDNDNDGIYDTQDKCPNEAEDFDGFEDQDGCLDIDNDHDGIPDKLDKCPNVPEDIDGYMDEDGCPDGGKPAVQGQSDVPQKPAEQKPAAVTPVKDTLKKQGIPVKK
jgi:parallel beta-helix repeat protein